MKHPQKKSSLTRNKIIWRNRVTLTVYCIFVFLFQELVFRIGFPLPEITNFNRISYQPVAPGAKPSFIRNERMLWKSYPDTFCDFKYDLNVYGFRDRNWDVKKSDGMKRIMFIGDSFVEGMMSDAGHTIPVSFSAAASENGIPVETMNFGMMGIGLNEYIKLIVDAIPLFQPDYVVLVLFSNDVPFQQQYTPSPEFKPVYGSYLKPRVLELIGRWRKKDPVPFRWKFSGKPYYPPVPSPNNPWTYYENDLKKDVTPAIAEAMKKGDFNFFRSNWILEEEKFLKAPADLRAQLAALKEFTGQNHAKMFVCYIPSRNQVSTYYYQFEKQYCLIKCPDALDLTAEQYQVHGNMLKERCGQLSVPFYNFTGEIKTMEQSGVHLYWNYDDHMRGRGYSTLGRKMFEWWKGLQDTERINKP